MPILWNNMIDGIMGIFWECCIAFAMVSRWNRDCLIGGKGMKSGFYAYMLFIVISFCMDIRCLLRLRKNNTDIGKKTKGVLLFSALAIVFYALAVFMAKDCIDTKNLWRLKSMSIAWMSYYLVRYAQVYTGQHRFCRQLHYGALALALLDTAILASGICSYEVTAYSPFLFKGIEHCSIGCNILHLCHLSICYVLAGSAVAIVIAKYRRTPKIYCWRYGLFFLLMGGSVLLNGLFLLGPVFGTEYDLSIITYGFTAYLLDYTTFRFKPVGFIRRFHSLLVDVSTDGMAIFDYRGILVSFNRACADIFALENAQIGALTLDEFVSAKGFPINRHEALQKAFEITVASGEGKERCYSGNYVEIQDEQRLFVGSYFAFRDITEESKLRKREEFLATRDHLTGIPNRSFFLQQAQAMLLENADTEFAVVRFDIDNFKIVNELFGNKAGDLVLKSIAQMLESNYPTGAYSRLDKDHFALLVPAASLDLKQLNDNIKASIRQLNLPINLRASIGVYAVKNHAVPMDQMCNWAAMAARTVKGNYYDYFAYYEGELREQMLREQEIIGEMEEALNSGQFEIFLQPQINHSTKQIVGAEALVRWRHPDHGYVSPAQFIPVFEKNGFITQLDQYVWECACKCLSSWADRGGALQNIPISVNISRMDFYRTDLCAIFIALIEKHELPPSMLKLEITESAYIDDPEQVIFTVKELQKNGFTVEMDDFGSGDSSLNTLKNIPVDVLKLDMKFLRDDGDKEKGGNILHSIVRMANWINLPVIAEGVETKTQADYLQTIGCNVIQGYYYSRPVPIDEFEKLAEKNAKAAADTEKNNPLPEAAIPEKMWDPDSSASILFNSFWGAAAIVELFDGNLEILRCNNNFCTACGIEEEMFRRSWTEILQLVHPEDCGRMLELFHDAYADSANWKECSCRWKISAEQYCAFKVHAKYIVSHGERQSFCLIAQRENGA